MGRDYRKKGDAGRDGGGFAAIPWAVFDSPAYARLGHPAKALLLEFARQFVRDNNGKLLCSMAHLRPRGWKSADVVHRAKSELLEAGFIFETCKGQRPNREMRGRTRLVFARQGRCRAAVPRSFRSSSGHSRQGRIVTLAVLRLGGPGNRPALIFPKGYSRAGGIGPESL